MRRLLGHFVVGLLIILADADSAGAAGAVDANWYLMLRLINSCNPTEMQTAFTSYPFVDPNDVNTTPHVTTRGPFLRIAIGSKCDIDTKLQMMKVLLEAGEDPNYKLQIAYGHTFIEQVIFGWGSGSRQSDGVLMLLEHGADPNTPIPPSSARGVLFELAAYGDSSRYRYATPPDTAEVTEIIKILVAHGVSVDQPSDGGFTPLLLGAFNHADVSVLSQLINLGANLQAVNVNGLNARDLSQVSYGRGWCVYKRYPTLDIFFEQLGVGTGFGRPLALTNVKTYPRVFPCYVGY
jgi:hypothetical protein